MLLNSKKFYQTQWHGIKFQNFILMDHEKLADENFYKKFYYEFYKYYSSFEDLDSQWLLSKKEIANFILRSFYRHNQTVLSIGCGIGIIEKNLLKKISKENFFVTEVSKVPLKFISQDLSSENIFIGSFPSNIPDQKYFDNILLLSVDYCFEDKDFIQLLNDCYLKLNPRGRLLVISASYLSSYLLIKYATKDFIKNVLFFFGLITRGQLWGYQRTASCYRNLFKKSFFSEFQVGFMSNKIFYIEGQRID